MKNSQFIILHWLYTVFLANGFYWTFAPKHIMFKTLYVIGMFMLLSILPIFVKFVLDDIEDEYNDMWRQLKRSGVIL